MRTLRFLLQKEFRQIFRNKAILRMIFMAPTLQLLLLPLAADYEVKNVNVAVVDHDHSSWSRRLIEEFAASGHFRLVGYEPSYNDALYLVERNEADIILEFPPDFERTLVREEGVRIMLGANATNGIKGSLGAAYAASLIRSFNDNIRAELVPVSRFNPVPRLDVLPSVRFNPYFDYALFMAPGILAVLLTMVGGFLAALNIVREKEIGTIEQINVTPIRKWQFVLGKLIPFWVLGLVAMTIGLAAARLAYDIVPLGGYLVIYTFAAVYMVAVLGFGLFISTLADTQQQAMFISFFFMMIFILLGGLYTPIDSMPGWAIALTEFNPAAYFIRVMRMVTLKGSGFADLWPEFRTMGIFALALNGLAVLNYRKRS